MTRSTARRRLAGHAVPAVRAARARSAWCTLDRPEARNAMTPAMYFGIRYAVSHVDADPDLAGLLHHRHRRCLRARRRHGRR